MRGAQFVATTLVGLALVGTLIAAAVLDSTITSPSTNDGTRSITYEGYYTPRDALWAANVTTPNGTASCPVPSRTVSRSLRASAGRLP
jgi:hypothetical protein